MFERFAQPARDAVVRAIRYATDAGAGETRPEHLLRALLDDSTSLTVRILADSGAPLADLRDELDRRRLQYVDGLDADDAEALRVIGIDLDEVVRRIDRNLGGPVPACREPRLSRGSKKALELALREAVALKHGHIGSEHLLLGLVRGGDRVVADTFAVFSLDAREVRRRVASAVGASG